MSAAHHLPTITESTFAIVSQMLCDEGIKNPDAKAIAHYIEKLVDQEVFVTTENLIERFQSFRGTLRDTTIENIVADRHRGHE